MRSLFSLVGLLMVLAVVGWLAKNQWSGRAAPAQLQTAPSDAPPVPSGSPLDIEQQYRQALEGAMQPPRPLQDP